MNCKSRVWVLGDLELNRRSRGNTSCHVTTSQRRDVARPIQQVTQRRDVTTIYAPVSLKARGDLISEVSRNVRI